MTQVFDDDSTAIPVTVLKAGPCTVVQLKTEDQDGYTAAQLGFEDGSKKAKKNQPYAGHFEKHDIEPKKHLSEFPILKDEELSPGEDLTVEMFEDIEKVDVCGTSKGKGFSGLVKRHNASTGPKSHGSRCIREPGSIGHAADPSRVFKGKKMAGQMGNAKTTIENLEVVRIIPEKEVLLVKGSVPGPNDGLVRIQASKKELRS